MVRNYLLALLLLGSMTAVGQIAPHAAGLRFSSSDEIESVGVELSYQMGMGSANRLEIDLGWNENSFIDLFRLAGFYQWVFPIEQGFQWYVGAGGGLGLLDYDNRVVFRDDSDVFLIVGGQAGIEYSFVEVPLQLSLDLRPEAFIGDVSDNLDIDLGFSVRYQFR